MSCNTLSSSWVALAYKGESKSKALALLDAFFCEAEDGWTHPRIDELIAKYEETAEKRRAAGAKGGKSRRSTQEIRPEINTINCKEQKQSNCLANAPKPITNNQEPSKKKGKEKPARFVPEEVTSGEIDRQLYADMIKTRKTPMTATAWDGIRREAEKAGMSLESVLRLMAERGWRGFRADWQAVLEATGKAPAQGQQGQQQAPGVLTDPERIAWGKWVELAQQGYDRGKWARWAIAAFPGGELERRARAMLAKAGAQEREQQAA